MRRLMLIMTMIVALTIKAQDDEPRRWAVDVRMSPTRTMTTHYDATATLGSNPASTSGPNFGVHAEYFLPRTAFSLTAGYDSETLDYYSGDVSADLRQLSVGSRWYFLSKSYPVQPYVGLTTFWNLAERNTSSWMSMSGGSNYRRDYTVRAPLFSVAPVAGLDIYLFSSVALEFDYGYRMAIGARARSTTVYSGSDAAFEMRSPMHRHAFSIGLKLTFPFRFTSYDLNGLLDSILNN